MDEGKKPGLFHPQARNTKGHTGMRPQFQPHAARIPLCQEQHALPRVSQGGRRGAHPHVSAGAHQRPLQKTHLRNAACREHGRDCRFAPGPVAACLGLLFTLLLLRAEQERETVSEVLRIIREDFRFPFMHDNYPRTVRFVFDLFTRENVDKIDPDMRITISAIQSSTTQNEYGLPAPLVTDLCSYIDSLSVSEFSLYICLAEGGLAVARMGRICCPVWDSASGATTPQRQPLVGASGPHTASFGTICGTTNTRHALGHVTLERSVTTGGFSAVTWHPDERELYATMQQVTVLIS